MAAAIEPALPAGFLNASLALVSAAADLAAGVQRAVVGPANVRTARDNAWAATLEDRARHEARDELTREVAARLARRPHEAAQGRAAHSRSGRGRSAPGRSAQQQAAQRRLARAR